MFFSISRIVEFFFLLVLCRSQCEAFSVQRGLTQSSSSIVTLNTVSRNSGSKTILHAQHDRRLFLDASLGQILTYSTLSSLATAPAWFPTIANAVFDDLAMPTLDEQKKSEDDAYAERLRFKAELQKKAAAPKNINESFKNEQEKQGEMKKKTKQEMRDAMCEELGRGC